MYSFYATRNYNINQELNNYILTSLNNILSKKDILSIEIIENIVNNMDLNYQWIEIRKFFNLENAPLNLDFNLENYKDICKKYLTNITIAFIYNDYQAGYLSGNPTLYFLSTFKIFDVKKQNDYEYLREFVDIIYHINKSSESFSFNSIYIENLNIQEIKNIIVNGKDDYDMKKNYYENFIMYCVENRKWRTTIDIENGWNDRMDLVEAYQKYHNPKEDQEHMDKYINLYKISNYEAAFHACTCWNIGKCNKNNYFSKYNQIKFKHFIKEITYQCIDFEGAIGIIIDNKFAFCCTWPGGFTVININHLDGSVKISELIDFTIFKKITPVVNLIKDYGNIILK